MSELSIFHRRSSQFVLWITYLLLFSLVLLSSPSAHPASAAPQTITNGTQFVDTSGNVVHAHGGGILKVGSYYYWFGENRNANNTFRYVSAYRSTDLKNWEFRNNVLTQSSAAELNSANIERPKVIFNASTNRYVMWMHKENGTDYGEARAAVASSATVDGNYTYHGSFRPLGHMSRDITLFNDNGTAYMISAANENFDLHIYRLTSDYLNVSTLVGNFWPGGHREAPAMFKRGSVYFLLTSAATGWNPNQARYATASNIAGPWTGWTNVGDGTTFGSQSTYVLPVQGTQTTSYLYMGDRWAGAWGGPVNDSRYVWLPISFPSSTSMSMSWFDQITIDTETGTVQGGSDPNLITVNDNTTGSGQNQFNYSGTWSYGSQNGAYQNDNHWSSAANNAYQVAFTGIQVQIYASRANNHGIFAVSIDGGAETNVDLYSATRQEQMLVWTSPTLSNASHTVRVRVTGNRNGSSSGAAIIADRVTIRRGSGTVPTNTPSPSITRVNDNTMGTGQNQFNYSGTWSYASRTGAYQNDNHWSSAANNAYQVAFNGTRVQIYSARANNHGIFAVSIDGGAETNVDLYASTRTDQVLVWTSPVLTRGNHTVRVRVTGNRNASSTGASIVADRVDITP